MNQPLRILYVAYPLLPVSDASCGGAEQMLWMMEREMAARGHFTVVAACTGSQVSGELWDTGFADTGLDRFAERDAEHTARVLELIVSERRAGRGFDLIHDENGSFWRHAEQVEEPVLLSAHLPRDFYGDELAHAAGNVAVSCVSDSQRRSFSDVPHVISVVPNGIAIDRFTFSADKHDYLLWLGRICEEKGAHIAIDVARQCNLPLVLAGEVYPFSYHQEYFRREIEPHLAPSNEFDSHSDAPPVCFVRRPSFTEKSELLRHARAVLIPSVIEETSSLVAMEAAACGTSVIAFRRGALPEVVADEITGFVVGLPEEMVAAVGNTKQISPSTCRDHAEKNFSAGSMADGYERLYRALRAPASRREVTTSALAR
jgi:glycosyltransferase involved in cell wall biosynthesis